MREVDMGGDRETFSAEGMPVYEGRMLEQYDHRAKAYVSGRGRTAVWAELPFGSTAKAIVPQWRLDPALLSTKVRARVSRFRVGFCDVTSPSNARTFIAAVLPQQSVAGHTVPTVIFGDQDADWYACLWLGVANSFCMDFLARQKTTLHMTFSTVDSLPFPRPDRCDPVVDEIVWRVVRLSCRGDEMKGFRAAMAMHQGWDFADASPLEGESEREDVMAELEALVALRLFELDKAQLAHILDSFPLIRERDEDRWSEYRTKRVILEAYDALAARVKAGKPYQTRFSPLAVNPRAAHPREGGEVIPLPVKLAAPERPAATCGAGNVPDLATVDTDAWTRPHSTERGEIQAAILAVLRVNNAPMDRRQARVAALICLEPHLLASMLESTEKAQWMRVVGADASTAASASIDATLREWGAALSGLRGRERLVEDLQQNTWSLGIGTEVIDTSGWPEGRASFVVSLLRRLQQSTQMDAIILKLPTVAQQWLANAV
jgi:hypothetical protein